MLQKKKLMDTESIIYLISQGQIAKAISGLRKKRQSFSMTKKIEIDLISSRFKSLHEHRNRNLISYEEGERELGKITLSLLNLLNTEPKGNKTTTTILEEIEELKQEWNAAGNIKNNASRVREKNQVARKIMELLIQDPTNISDLLDTNNEGIISGIALKTKVVPDIEDIEILEQLSQKCIKNFSKGMIVNALAELIYSGQLRIGDEEKIENILTRIKTNCDLPLKKNIERVEVALDFLLGKLK